MTDDARGIWDDETQTWVTDEELARIRDAVHGMWRRKMSMNHQAIHHLDGDPTNNAIENLRIVDIRGRRR